MRGNDYRVFKKVSEAKYADKEEILFLSLVSGEKIRVKIISNEFKILASTPIGLAEVHAYRVREMESGRIRTLVSETDLSRSQ